MLIDQFGRRLVGVPCKKVPCHSVLVDSSDADFWRQLPGEGGIQERLGVVSDLTAVTFRAPGETAVGPFSAEVFAHDYGLFSLGSSRHVEHGRYVWKGVGRNQLAVRSDWLHSWGGMHLAEGMEEFVFSQKLLASGAVVPVKALLAYETSEYPQQYFILRDMRLPRLASVSVRFNHPRHLQALARHYETVMGESGALAWRQVLARQWELLRRGWAAPTPSVANFDIAGRTLDMTGGQLFSGVDAEFCWVEARVASPLDPIFWVLEHALAPLHAALWKLSTEALIHEARGFFNERSALFALNPIERQQLAEQKIKRAEWTALKTHWHACSDKAQVRDVGGELKRQLWLLGNSPSAPSLAVLADDLLGVADA